MLIIHLPFKTPTINHLYGQHGVRKYLKPEAKELRKKINDQMAFCNPKPYANKILKVSVEIYEDWHTKKGDVKKKDVANREKFLIDSVFGGLGLDDKFIFKHTMEKKQSNKEFAIIRIEEYP